MLKSGKQWPIFVSLAIMGVVGLGYWTIKETIKSDLSQSDIYLSKYQNVDEHINDYLEKNIEFNKHFTAKVVSAKLSEKNTSIEYGIATKSNIPVNDANVTLVLSRPIADAKDITRKPDRIENGVYVFEGITLPKKGRWNLYFHTKLNGYERFDNLKADTRYKGVYDINEVSAF